MEVPEECYISLVFPGNCPSLPSLFPVGKTPAWLNALSSWSPHMGLGSLTQSYRLLEEVAFEVYPDDVFQRHTHSELDDVCGK